MKKLRPYQGQAHKATFARVDAHAKVRRLAKGLVLGLLIRVLVVMATGLGKTVVAARVARLWQRRYGTRVLFLMHMVDALVQARKEFEEALPKGTTTGLLTGEVEENLDADVVFATFQSMAGLIDEEFFLPDDFGLVIVDEAHHGHAESYRAVIEHFEPDMLYGMTATPDRMDGLDIRDLFGDPVFEYNLAEALADGRWLSQVDYRVMTDNINKRELNRLVRRVREGDRTVTMKDIDRRVFLREKLQATARIIRREQRQGDKKTIIFCKNNNHLRAVHRYFPEAEAYHSRLKSSTLKERLEAFRNGDIRILLVIDKFNEAIDIPDAELIVFLRATDSRTIWLQQLGRGLRKLNGKDVVVVLDFVANCRRVLDIKKFGISVEKSGPPDRTEDGDGRQHDVETGWDVTFSNELVDVLDVLDRLQQGFYPTIEEASAAAIALGIETGAEYRGQGLYKSAGAAYKADPRLPSVPEEKYADDWEDFGGWRGFLDTSFYPTIEEASEAAIALGITSGTQYQGQGHFKSAGPAYKADPRLPSEPNASYAGDWKEFGGWVGFLGKEGLYPTIEEASAAAIALGIETSTEYSGVGIHKSSKPAFKADPRLPSNPNITYSEDWEAFGAWRGFLQRRSRYYERESRFYPTIEEASAAAIALGITSAFHYLGQGPYKSSGPAYKADQRLSSKPNVYYGKENWKAFGGWKGFLGTGFYPTIEEASAAAIALGIESGREYKGQGPYKSSGPAYKADPRLPSNPNVHYGDDWKALGGWDGFLGWI